MPASSLIGIIDPMTRLEKLSPLSRLHISVFLDKINNLGKKEADIPLLAATFNTPAWSGQFDKGSTFYKQITSLPNCSEESINLSSLSLLAMLWCKGNNESKSEILF
jgi:hypothetical protein